MNGANYTYDFKPDSNLRIAVVGAHPDDAEIGAGGLLALHGGLIISLTCGENGERSAQVSKFEQAEAARALGCEYELLEEQELTVPCKRLVTTLDRIFEGRNINTVITHHVADTNQEHVIATKVAIAAARSLDNVLMFEPMPPAGRMPVPFRPQMYVDISLAWEKKQAAIKAYKSQIYGRRLMVIRKALDIYRGCEIGGGYAEAYEVVRWKL